MHHGKNGLELVFAALLALGCGEQLDGENKETSCQDDLDFADSNLEEHVLDTLEEFGFECLENAVLLTDLYAEGSLEGDWDHIQDLGGIENLVALESLDLSTNDIDDLSLLSELAELRELKVGDNPFVDASPLGQLTELEVLRIGASPNLTDISFVSNLAELTEFSCWGCDGVTDFSPLASATQLARLYLADTAPASLDWIVCLEHLEQLFAEGMIVDDFSPIGQLTGLTNLELGQSSLADVSFLEGLVDLRRVVVWNAQVADLEPLSALPELDTVLLAYNQIADISPLVTNEGLAADDYIDISGNPIDCDDQAANIAALEARGVEVISDCP